MSLKHIANIVCNNNGVEISGKVDMLNKFVQKARNSYHSMQGLSSYVGSGTLLLLCKNDSATHILGR